MAGTGYIVRVHGVVKGKRRAAPSLVVDLVPRDGHWVIKDFHYPDGDDLAGDLRQNQKDRDHAKPNRRVKRSEFLDDAVSEDAR
jgi:23S rRNA U2552 (ribose-2'-O)-methylase RlmE/FtsJ